MNTQNCFSALDVGISDRYLSVESTGTKQCGIEYITPVCSRNYYYALIVREAVHFNKQLVQRLLTLVMTAAKTCTSLSADSIYLIDEYYGRCMLLCLVEKVSNTGSTDADKHLNEIRTAYREERNIRFTGYRLCKQSLTCTGRAKKKYASGYLSAKRLILSGISHEVDYLAHFFLFFLSTRNIRKGYPRTCGRLSPCICLREL